MGLSRRRGKGGHGHSNIWPGFVDAVTTLLMVLMFVVTIFTVMQSVLRDRITSQDSELTDLGSQLGSLADALGLEKSKVADLEGGLNAATAEAERQSRLITTLNAEIATQSDALQAAQGRLTDFEAQVAALIAERDVARGEATSLGSALASARSEVDAQAEAARLDAARREALEALIADLRQKGAETEAALTAAETRLNDREAARLADDAAARALRDRLQNSEEELTAMTLALEESRKRAEETLTLLAAAEAAKKTVEDGQLSEAERQAALLATAREALAKEQAVSADGQRRLALLNEQMNALRGQLQALQGVLDESSGRDRTAQVQIENLGSQLNSALAQVAAEQRRRAALEEAERDRLETEAKDLRRYRSEFFGRLSQLLEGREGVRVVGDRFVFSSEVLFQSGSADLSAEGRSQIAGVAQILNDVASEIPANLDWIIRVDGHTDTTPLSGTGRYRDNWELSQGRALSVVRYMIDGLGFAPSRLAATGFGEYRPVAEGDSPEARAANRRIELKLTER